MLCSTMSADEEDAVQRELESMQAEQVLSPSYFLLYQRLLMRVIFGY